MYHFSGVNLNLDYPREVPTISRTSQTLSLIRRPAQATSPQVKLFSQRVTRCCEYVNSLRSKKVDHVFL